MFKIKIQLVSEIVCCYVIISVPRYLEDFYTKSVLSEGYDDCLVPAVRQDVQWICSTAHPSF